jgi:hypothetical protein
LLARLFVNRRTGDKGDMPKADKGFRTRLWLGALALGLAMVAAGSLRAASERNQALLDHLVASYPELLASHDSNSVTWKDGTVMPFDDGKGQKAFETLLNEPDIEDQFYAPYQPGQAGTPPGVNIDPGRVRYEPFFAKMYGDCRKHEVEGKLVDVAWLPKHGGAKLTITRVNGVAEKLQAVSDELDRLPPALITYLTPSAGTYNCRVIAGTDRPSVHGSGAAIDINVKFSDYWRWAKTDAAGHYPYKNRIPWEIVEIFEKHGFIWGGKWYHYDTMHFEYRPELLP